MDRSLLPLVLASFVAACGSDVSLPTAPGPTPSDPDLQITDVLPGQPVTLAVSGMPPLETVLVVVGTTVGEGPCLATGTCAGVTDPVVVARGRTDDQGHLDVRVEAPPDARPGASYAFQALAPLSGATAAPRLVSVLHPDAVCDPVGAHLPPGVGVDECEALAHLNATRAVGADCGARGWFGPAGPLTMNDELRLAARTHAAWMADSGSFSHTSPGGLLGDDLVERAVNAGYDYRFLTENIARHQELASGVVRDWTRSDGHCANYMSPRLRDVGIGLVVDGRGRNVWVADHGQRHLR